jgi:CTP synthase (UTP-ammonia lyase)
MLILRADCDIDISSIQKLGAMCHIESKNIFLSKTLKNIYLVPNSLFEQKIVDAIYRYFKIKVPICSKLAY